MLHEAERFQIAERFMNGATAITNGPQSLRVKHVFAWLHGNAVMVFPDANGRFRPGPSWGAKLCEGSQDRRVWIYVYDVADQPGLKPEDVQLFKLCDPKQIAAYIPENHFVAINGHRALSPFVSGVVLLRESWQAWVNQVCHFNQLIGKPQPAYLFVTAEFEHEILMAHGGARYLQLILLRKKQIESQLGGTGLGSHMRFRAFPYPLELEAIWGPAADREEQKLRIWKLHENALFEYAKGLKWRMPEMLDALAPCL